MNKHIFENNKNYRFLTGYDISPKDDAFHGNINLLDIEWWYFDAVFDNEYSIHVGIRVYHLKNSGMVESRINIYKNGKVVVESTKKDFLNSFQTSNDFPYVKINNNEVIDFDKVFYNKYGKWKYKIKLKIGLNQVNLIFTGTTKGWKIETSETCWTVALPKAFVEGEITVKGKTFNVKGTGYHDHNWGYSPSTMFKNIGWLWGRIAGDYLGLTWANTIQSPNKGDLLAIINQDDNSQKNKNEFFSIDPIDIKLNTKGFLKDHGKLIPSEFELKIDSELKNGAQIKADLQVKSLFTQHSRIFTAHYWRYHVLSMGSISVNNTKEILDKKNQIMELLLFKSLN